MEPDFRRLYQEAVQRETDFRDAAFLGLTTSICGISIRPMAPRDFLILDGIGSPFITGQIPTHRQTVKFLWQLSPEYRDSKFRAWLFALGCRWMDFAEAQRGILAYLKVTFLDAPTGSPGSKSEAYAGWLAYLVDSVSSEYGWPLETIMRTPLRILNQQLRCIRKRHNPNAVFINGLSRKVMGDRLRLKTERMRLLQVLMKRGNPNQ